MHTFKPDQLLNYPTQKTKGVDTYDCFAFNVKPTDKIVFDRYNSTDESEVVVKANGFEWIFAPSDLTPKSEVLKVRVVKEPKSPLSWYRGKVGQIFEVSQNPKYDYAYDVVYSNSGEFIDKSDCIVVTDQKFKEGGKSMVGKDVFYKGIKSKVVDYDINAENKYKIKFIEYGVEATTWVKENELSENVDGVLPFTEELFNQGKYDVYGASGIINDLHKYEGEWYSVWGLMDTSFLTLKEKEVVVYYIMGFPKAYTDKQKAINEARLIKGVVVSWNETTRTVEKVWDYLTDKK